MNLEANIVPAASTEGTGALKGVQIFRVGTWRGSRSVEATPKMLKQIVDNFSTINQIEGFGVPVKIGHTDGVGSPAFGWMSNVSSDGSVLTADFTDVPLSIIDAVGKRRYNSVSVELYPSVAFDGKAYENVLGGVAFLGSEWPAVKGLKPLSAASRFTETADDHYLLTMSKSKEPEVADEAKTTFSQETHDALVLAATTKLNEAHAVEVTKLTADVTTQTARADKAEADLKKFRDDADKAAIDAVIEAAEKSGKIVPANKDKMTAFAASVLSASDPAKRADLMATFKELVGGMKGKVSFKEEGSSTNDDGAAQGQKTADIIDGKAKELMSADTTGKLTYADAVNKVLKSDAELRRAYATE